MLGPSWSGLSPFQPHRLPPVKLVSSHIAYSHPLFLSCSGFLLSFCTWDSFWQTLLVTNSKFTLPSLFTYRFLEIPPSQGKALVLVWRWAYNPVLANYLEEFWLWNIRKGFPFVIRGRYASKNSQPHGDGLETWTCCRAVGGRKGVPPGTQASYSLCTNDRNTT